MKFRSQLSAVLGTDSTSNTFGKARRKLVLLYLGIIATVIGLFAFLVVLQVSDKLNEQKLPPQSQIVLNATEAQQKASALKPGRVIVDTVYALEQNTLLYKVIFDDGEDVEVDVLTGKASLGEQPNTDNDPFLLMLLTDDISEIIWLLGLFIFILASLGSIAIANMTLRPIAESVKSQKRFISDAAHELRNPLASLHTTLESYIRSNDNSKTLRRSIATDLLTEVKRLITTSEALLQFENQERRPKIIVPCPVSDHLAIVVARLEPQLTAKQQTITPIMSEVMLPIDTQDLETILYNLLHNASKFSPAHATIKISWDGKKLRVEDTGIGIAPQHIPHLFERFYKVDQARTFLSDSNGLGLALVHDIATMYGATVVVTSRVGVGTTFTLSF